MQLEAHVNARIFCGRVAEARPARAHRLHASFISYDAIASNSCKNFCTVTVLLSAVRFRPESYLSAARLVFTNRPRDDKIGDADTQPLACNR